MGRRKRGGRTARKSSAQKSRAARGGEYGAESAQALGPEAVRDTEAAFR